MDAQSVVLDSLSKIPEVLDNIPFLPDLERLMLRLCFHRDREHLSKIVPELLQNCVRTVRPKAAYSESLVEAKTSDSVDIGGVTFVSPLLRVNLDHADRVFPFVVTGGRELAQLVADETDPDKLYGWLVIQEAAQSAAYNYLQAHLVKKFNLEYIWSLSPGDMQAWPLENNRLVFSLLGDIEGSVGIRINSDYSLSPAFSSSGLFYYSHVDFESCQLCTKELCMGRRAPCSPELAKKYAGRGTDRCGH